jgi:hypothetical protein
MTSDLGQATARPSDAQTPPLPEELPMEVDIQTYLRGFTGKPVCYFPNPGNAGDNLITLGTHHAFRAAGLAYTTPRLKGFSPRGKVIFYGGGGNLVSDTRHSYRTIQALHREAGHLTILPHTIRGVDELIASFGSNVTVICRERVTYDYVTRLARGCTVLLSHDMGLHLDARRLLAETPRFPRLAIAGAWLRAVLTGQARTNLGNLVALLGGGPVTEANRAGRGQRRLVCFRTDDESTDIDLPPDNIDLPRVLALGGGPYALAAHVGQVFLRTIDRFDEVVTNRLHVAIGAALLGKQVKFHTNNYYKNRAVYEYSVRDRFPNVQWMG